MSEQTYLRTTILRYFAGVPDTEGGAIDELGIADDVAFSDAFDRCVNDELAVAQRALTTACDNLAELTCECRCPWLQAVQTANDTLCEQVSTYPCTACETPHPAECWARWYTDRARAAMQSEREAATRGN